MVRLWINGRLSWLWIGLCVYTTLCVLGFDYAWRLIEAPFEVLAAGVIAAWISGSAAMIAMSCRWFRPS